MTGENALELNNVTKKYEGFCLQNIDLKLPAGCIMGLIGENGAGKSTTMKLLTGAARPDEGQICVLGVDNRTREFDAVKNQIGVVLDEARYSDYLTPKQVNRMMKGIYENWDEKQFDEYLKKFDLPVDKKLKDFSRGMKMKFGIAAALSHEAKLLLLDEATSGLDPVARDEIVDIFYEFTREEDHSILISSHIVSDLEKLCDYIAFLHKGKLYFCEEKDALKEKYGILSCTKEIFESLDREAVAGYRTSPYGMEVLVEREKVPSSFSLSPAGIEDIMVYMVRGEQTQA